MGVSDRFELQKQKLPKTGKSNNPHSKLREVKIEASLLKLFKS